jgi:hypothetical protein
MKSLIAIALLALGSCSSICGDKPPAPVAAAPRIPLKDYTTEQQVAVAMVKLHLEEDAANHWNVVEMTDHGSVKLDLSVLQVLIPDWARMRVDLRTAGASQ